MKRKSKATPVCYELQAACTAGSTIIAQGHAITLERMAEAIRKATTTTPAAKHTALPKEFYGQCDRCGFEPDTPADQPGHALIVTATDTLCLNCWCESVLLPAEFIVRAANNHERLLAALRKIVNLTSHPLFHDQPELKAWEPAIDAARAAIAEAQP